MSKAMRVGPAAVLAAVASAGVLAGSGRQVSVPPDDLDVLQRE